jgi:hypothetical protein
MRWNDNVPVTTMSDILGTNPVATWSRYSRTSKNYNDVLQPDIIRKYNVSMGCIDRFYQNNNHLRIKIKSKKRF